MRIIDTNGIPHTGFDWKDCMPIRGDSTAHPVRWKANTNGLPSTAVHIEFSLRQGELYGFDVAPSGPDQSTYLILGCKVTTLPIK